MSPLAAVCCTVMATGWLIGYTAGSWLAGLVAGAVVCVGIIWELGQ